MDASALATLLDNLEKSWSALDWWLNFWTALVVLGVAVELVILIIEYLRERKDFRRGSIHSPEKPSLLLFGAGFVGAALVVFGVAGEFRVHIEAGKIESEIREASRKLVSIANGEAAKANERASKNERESDTLRNQAAGLKKQAEDERLARVKLEEQLAWRNLSPRQQEKLIAAMLPFTGTKVHIMCIVGDAEGCAYANDFDGIVRRAGWKPTEVSPSGMLVQGNAPQGLILAYRELNGPAKALLGTLKRVGIKPDIFGTDGNNGYDLVIEIGIKLRPGQNVHPSKGSVIIDLPVNNPR